MQKLLVAVFNLFDGMLVVVGSNRYVSAVDDLQSGLKGVHCEGDIVPAIERKPTRACADTGRPKARSGTVRCPGILIQLVRSVSIQEILLRNAHLRKERQ
jgi:hypothetical protein